MVDYTTNHGLQLWADDEAPWSHREDMQKLDTLLQAMSSDGLTLSGLDSIGATNLTVNGKPSDRHWEEDPNSPLIGSAATSHTLNLANTYDKIYLEPSNIENTSGGGQDIRLQINEYAGSNYYFKNTSGSAMTNQSSWLLVQNVNNGSGVQSSLEFSGRPTSDGAYQIYGPTGGGANKDGILHGVETYGMGDVTSFTILGGTGNIDVDVTVYGWSKS